MKSKKNETKTIQSRIFSKHETKETSQTRKQNRWRVLKSEKQKSQIITDLIGIDPPSVLNT